MADSLAPLATVADLANYVQEAIPDDDPAATLSLQIASGVIRSYLGYDVSSASTTEYCDPINGSFVELRQAPVLNVVAVEYIDADTGLFTLADATQYTLSRRLGVLALRPGLGIRWPTDPESVRVNYSYGYDEIPDAIWGVVLGIAARQWSTPVGVESERLGGYNVRYADRHDDALTPVEKLALRAYLRPVVA